MPAFSGTAREVGRRLGTALRPWIRRQVEEHRRGGGAGERAREAGRAFAALLREAAPHWLEEAEGLAEGAGVSAGDLLEINGLTAARTLPSCTSVVVAPDRAWRGHPLLLKIRDERPRHQFMAYRCIRGTIGLFFGADPCNLGVAQGRNRFGLAVANNTGGTVCGSGPVAGFNDCHVARMILEFARNVEEGLDLFRGLFRAGRVGRLGGGRGMILLLADGRGPARVIEAGPEGFRVSSVERGFAVWTNHWRGVEAPRFGGREDPADPAYRSSLARYARAVALLQGAERIGPARLEALARDRAGAPYALCNDTDAFPWRTVSAFLYELDPRGRVPVRVAPGAPCRVPFRDVPPWRAETPVEFLEPRRG